MCVVWAPHVSHMIKDNFILVFRACDLFWTHGHCYLIIDNYFITRKVIVYQISLFKFAGFVAEFELVTFDPL